MSRQQKKYRNTFGSDKLNRGQTLQRALGLRGRKLRLESLEERRVLTAVTVTNDLDLVNGDTTDLTSLMGNDGGDGVSLREAVIASNGTVGADEILFDVSLSGQTITLDGTQLQISDVLTINAGGLDENVTIDANQLSRVIEINDPAINTDNFDVTLIGLNITGGKTTALLARGGGILSLTAGTLTIDQSAVSGNQTEGDKSGGGGIRASGNVEIINSTINGNSTLGAQSRGGAIDAIGTVTLTQSTLSGNSTAGANADSGGIRSTSAITIEQSTVTNNQVLDAASSGGGVWNDNDAVIISNSILAGNTAAGGDADLRPGNGTLTVNHSLIGDTSDLSATQLMAINAGVGNLLDIDAMLAGLADNGGRTSTHALLGDSQAIDAGGATSFTFDQRGTPFDRIIGTAVDMGSYEVQPSGLPFVVVTTTSDELDFSNDDVSLREAIVTANQDPSIDEIAFSVLFNSPQTIDIASQLPTISDTVSINGPGQNLLTIDAGDGADDTFATGDGYRIFQIDDGAVETTITVTLSGMTLTGGDTSNGTSGGGSTAGANGGAIRSVEDLVVIDSTIIANATGAGADADPDADGGLAGNGGGIRVSGNLTLIGSTVANNRTGNGGAGGASATAGGRGGRGGIGGAIDARGEGSVVIESSTIRGNRTGDGGVGGAGGPGTGGDGGRGGEGAGIFATGAVTVRNSTITGNITGNGAAGGAGDTTAGADGVSGYGGGITGDTLDVSSSTITNNVAYEGAGLRAVGMFELSNSIVADNTSTLGNHNLQPLADDMLQVDYSLISDTTDLSATSQLALTSGAGNLLDMDPMLDALADNGGPTETQALLPGSPAIDAGDPGIAPDVDEFDQRGAGFLRVQNGRIDIGAFESDDVIVPDPSADFDIDDDIDGADFLAWQRGFGLTGTAMRSNGDANNDGNVDALDLGVWQEQFGIVVPELAAARSATEGPAAALVDLAMGQLALSADLADDLASDLVQQEQPLPTSTLTGEPLPAADVAGGLDESSIVVEFEEEERPEPGDDFLASQEQIVTTFPA